MRARRTHTLVALLWTALAAGCGTDHLVDVQLSRIDWQRLGITDYTFVYFGRGYLGWDPEGHRVEVHGNSVRTVVGRSNGLPTYGYHPRTIDALLDELSGYLVHYPDPDQVTLDYDPTFHFVRKASIDADFDSADEEFYFHIGCFSERTDGCPLFTISVAACIERKGEPTPLLGGAPWDTCIGYPYERRAIGQLEGDPNMVCCVEGSDP